MQAALNSRSKLSKELVSKERAEQRKGRAKEGSKEQATPTMDGEIPFEAALKQLESVVDRLEGGDLELEVALASFEEGVRLTQRCAEQLDGAERRVELLMKDGDEWVSKPFSEVPSLRGGEPDGPQQEAATDQDAWEEPDEAEELL